MNEEGLVAPEDVEHSIVLACLVLQVVECLLPKLQLLGLARQSSLIAVADVLHDALTSREVNILLPEVVFGHPLWILSVEVEVLYFIFYFDAFISVFDSFLELAFGLAF